MITNEHFAAIMTVSNLALTASLAFAYFRIARDKAVIRLLEKDRNYNAKLVDSVKKHNRSSMLLSASLGRKVGIYRRILKVGNAPAKDRYLP